MRTEAQIKDDIAVIEDLLKGDLTADEKKDFQETVDNLNAELAAVTAATSSDKKSETKAEKKEAKKSNAKIDSILSDINDIEELLTGDLSKDERNDFEETLADLREQLKSETAKVAEAAEEVVEPAKPAKEKKAKEPKPKKTKAAKEKKSEPVKEEKPEKKEAVKEKMLIVVEGKEYDIEDCKQAILALKARKKQSAKTSKKYKTKKPATKAANNIETAIQQVGSAVTTKAEENPKQVIAVFKEFKKKMNEAFNVLGKVISKQDVELLKKSLKDIDDIIEKYK